MTASLRYGRDYEVVQRLRPEPLTEREQAAQASVDDLDFEIFRHKMDMVALEGKETTMKLGASMAMRWGDVAFGIFTAQGDLAVCATGIYHHAVLSQIPVKYIVKHWRDEPSVGLHDGDAFFYNDPFYGGVHAPDMGLSIPVFAAGELVCFIGAAVHTGDIGGSEPGGMVCSAKSRYDEGMLLPPFKVGEKHALKEDLLSVLSTMTRDPRTMLLDLKARLAASRIAERRVLEIIAEKGAEFFVGALRRILTLTADAARKKVARLNDGIYRQPRFMDTVGPESQLLKINIVVEKRGDRIKLRFDGSSPMLMDRPVNSYFQGILGLAMVYFCGWFFHDLPANNGLLDCLDWEFPENCFVNAKGDVPTSYAPATQVAFAQGMFMCGARMIYSDDPLRAVATWFSAFALTIYGGFNQTGDPIADITPEMNATGCGARSDMDGVDVAGAFFATLSDCSDVEATEADRPLLYLFRNQFNHSYGHGKYRGGAGVGYGVMVHDVPWLGIGGFGFGSQFPSTLGIFGGRAAPPAFLQSVHGSNMNALLAAGVEGNPRNMAELYGGGDLPEKGQREYTDISVSPRPFLGGDTYYVPVTGGAGYGDVLERDPQAVMADVRKGLSSIAAAQDIYLVAYDPNSLYPDLQATAKRRAEARQERLRGAKPYGEFIKAWEKLRPPAGILRYYGDYPVSVAAPPQAIAA
ncbi:MAG: hydantoinase B/oxoprolinase family protein [Proteobacteria bacterium]|nr:hydantoinase B/oxoprolinase family protein [Pseudomonadota bacterium]